METDKIKEVLILLNNKIDDLRKQRRFCNEHNFSLESKSFSNTIEELEEIRFEIEFGDKYK